MNSVLPNLTDLSGTEQIVWDCGSDKFWNLSVSQIALLTAMIPFSLPFLFLNGAKLHQLGSCIKLLLDKKSEFLIQWKTLAKHNIASTFPRSLMLLNSVSVLEP